MALSTEELRSLLFDWLKWLRTKSANTRLSFDKCIQSVGRQHAVRTGSLRDDESHDCKLSHVEEQKLRLLIWDLILSRVLVPGSDYPGTSDGWPYLTVTRHGWKVIEQAGPIPYDPDGYLAQLKTDSPTLHPTAIRYVEEAILTFRSGAYLAAAVMLGAAAERILNDVTASIEVAIADAAKRKSFVDKAQRGKMRERVATVVGWCRNNRGRLCGDWTSEEGVDVVERLAHFIRQRRNDAGHPQDPPAVPTHEQIYASLVVFPSYCKAIYELKSFLDARPAAF